MKKIILAAGLAGVMASAMAQAIEGSVDVGKHSTNLSVGLGSSSPGLFLKGNWLRSNDDGSVAGAALGYNLSVGPLNVSPAAKALFTHPENGKDGFTVAVGSGVSYQLNSMWGVYGEYYYAPESFSAHLNHYEEAAGGVSFTPISLLTLRAGYQYVELNNKDSNKNNVLNNGPYLSASVSF